MTYTLHKGAEDDFAESARFYRREGSRALAARFLDEFERIANLLVEHPGIGTQTEDQRRWFPLSGFPYSVIYRETETGIRILVLTPAVCSLQRPLDDRTHKRPVYFRSKSTTTVSPLQLVTEVAR